MFQDHDRITNVNRIRRHGRFFQHATVDSVEVRPGIDTLVGFHAQESPRNLRNRRLQWHVAIETIAATYVKKRLVSSMRPNVGENQVAKDTVTPFPFSITIDCLRGIPSMQ